MGNIASHHVQALNKTQTDTRFYPPRETNSGTKRATSLPAELQPHQKPFLSKFGAAKARIHRTFRPKPKDQTNNKKTKKGEKHSKKNSQSSSSLIELDQSQSQSISDGNRRYSHHRDSKYQYPIDEQEQDRLIQMHFLLKQCFDGNFSAPVKNLLSRTALTSWDSSSINRVSWATSATSQSTQSSIRNTWVRQSVPPRVLDIACGTGTWAMEMAVDFPDAEVHGVDITDTMYPLTIKPPNVSFIKADVLDPKGLPYPSEYFDYVHMQLVYACFSRPDWTTIVKEIRRVLKPGGYVEFRELDPILHNAGPVTEAFLGSLTKGMERLHGINSFWSRYLCQYIERPGDMTDIHHEIVSVGVGWGRTVADMTYEAVEEDFRAVKRLVRTALSISSEEYESRVTTMMNEMRAHKTYENYHMCWARKPLLDLDSIFYDRQQMPTNIMINNSSKNIDIDSNSSDKKKKNNVDYSNDNILLQQDPHHLHQHHLYHNNINNCLYYQLNNPSRMRRMSSMSCLEGKMKEEERRRNDTVSDIYQFVEGYNAS
ncbi:hypothetical protein J3Q64DRAFT_1153972 [Phycomyces blakesleeanus]|uniref:Methyltransferase domain-containing protein n=2 Tax=Phycomyces blakesleeanus TaxID=4837 RepID=A0A167PPE9_PHYB8|nr:hypothetical protein PHYBLDRAFT_163418 [Phycomyces blakesleeanus NRRL 1555(-)]OAD78299.1 hypothetical protein PHYBLDRAFT_163418 [Phycomyces blakesleeanus NRRL 1555(-)]|eukprot:XP_018296339.1 hypothetical protein PHYBLDRAFT_163418 [Phycomyces blakesleeanus NRRL 1555(-)]